MKIKLPQPVTRLIGKVMLTAKKYGPEACAIGGILCGGAAVVVVGINTWKNKEKLQEDMKAVNEAKENLENVEQGDEKAARKELTQAYGQLSKDTVKTFGVPFVLETGSIILIWVGRNMLRKELANMGAAYALLLKSFEDYRANNVEISGPEVDEKCMFGENQIVIEENENGEQKIAVAHDRNRVVSRYARWWDAGEYDSQQGIWLWRNSEWRPDPRKNAAKLRFIQAAFNDKLKAYGFVFLNEVQIELGLPPTKDGQVVGWTADGKDGYIDFGIWPNKHHPRTLEINRPFLEGNSPNVLLDFNVDGPILYKLEEIYGQDYAKKLVSERI